MSEERVAAVEPEEKVPAEAGEKATEAGESMADYEKELEASLKTVREGDVLTGMILDVTDSQVTVDLKYYAEGVIKKEEISEDPDYNLKETFHPGDEITATVIRKDDGEGNILLSRKMAHAAELWDRFRQMMEDRTVVSVKIAEIVKSGAVAYLEGIRGFIPASKLAASYVEDLNEWAGKTIDVTIITVEEEKKRIVLSGREVARAKEKEEKKRQIEKCQVGAVMEGTVDTIKDYGAFVTLENGLSGLIHVSQISNQRIKHPGVALKEGQTVKVKIIAIKDGKISLSMKALLDAEEADEPVFDYKETGAATTGLGALLKDIKLS